MLPGHTAIPVVQQSVTYEEFYNRFMVQNKPCLIEEHVTRSWFSRSKWITESGHIDFDRLHALYGKDDVPVSDCSCRYFNSQKSEEMRFADFITYWKKVISTGYDYTQVPCLYLKDWHFFLEHPDPAVYHVPPFFESDWLNQHWLKDSAIHEPINDYRFVYMGPKGSSTPLHKDVYSSYSWSANLCGEKEWILIAPEREALLRKKYSQPGRELPYDIRPLLSDPQFVRDIDPILVMQSAGQIMFVPSDWIHQVRNTADTISINHNWFNACNVHFIWRGLLKGLRDVQSQIADLRESSSQWTIECQNLLRIHHGLNFQDFVEILQTKVQSLKRESKSMIQQTQGNHVPDPTNGSSEESTIRVPASPTIESPDSDVSFRLRHEVASLKSFLPVVQQELDRDAALAKFSSQVSLMRHEVQSLS